MIETRLSLAALDCATTAAARGASAARAALAARTSALPARDWRIAEAQSVLGACLLRTGDEDEGRALLRSANAELRTTLGPEHRLTRAAHKRNAGRCCSP